MQSALLYDNFCKTGNDVIYDVIIWVQDGNCRKWLERILTYNILCPSLIEIGSKTAEKNSAQTNKQSNRQTNRHYENNGHLAVNQYSQYFRCGKLYQCYAYQAYYFVFSLFIACLLAVYCARSRDMEYCDECVCMSVCPLTYLGNEPANFTKFSARVTCGRGSVLL